ncbi:16S rRNA (cytidine(1402)-2'-O)-methyltransferase [Candidatus Parcubacteria bacterium 4484_255]|nr:MAG: 16S rRNA (cytidine(1402)-2'-O)-methyltransferase [Candidatus Parcubacteria bacterium 4484_255]
MNLYVVATPIGNLQDISYRALETLKNVDYILCEDTRHTQKLLGFYNIPNKLISYHQHSGRRKINYILNLLSEGCSMALVSDAGTPGISDPGNKLINLATGKLDDLKIIPIPGPCALITALSVSGFPADKFIFYGFIPKKKGRRKVLEEIVKSPLTSVFYESGHRIQKTLNALLELNLWKKIVICRELTKKFETIYRGKGEELLSLTGNNNAFKGEFVVVVANK